MPIEMKPCPFCGGTHIRTYSQYNYIYCECELCGAKTKGVKAIECEDDDDFWAVNRNTSNQAKNRWNSRYTDVAQNQLDEIKKAKQDIYTAVGLLQKIQNVLSRDEWKWLCKTVNKIHSHLERNKEE